MKQIIVTFVLLVAAPARADVAAGHTQLPHTLLRLARFVGWPAGSLRPNDFTICIGDRRAAATAVSALPAGEPTLRWHGRAVRVRQIAAPAAALSCQMIFLGANDATARSFLEAVGTRPVLTVGTGTEFVRGGGQIALHEKDGTAQVQINVAALRRSGLRVNPQLLQVAEKYAVGGPP